ncbi:hypothetical protein D3C75_1173480 [compost metagenome]
MQHDGICGDAFEGFHALPDGFGDEWNDRMRKTQQTFQHVNQRITRTAQFRFSAAVHYRFGQLQIPVAELVPGEFIQNVGSDIKAIAVKRFTICFHRAVEFRQNPAVCQRQNHFAAV